MARKKLTEFAAKRMLFSDLHIPYQGIEVSLPEKGEIQIPVLSKKQKFVVKVDQGIKKRGKQGLIAINVSSEEIKKQIASFTVKGYSHFLIEPFVSHEKTEEKYLSIERMREGLLVRYSLKGGMEIEEHMDSVKSMTISSLRGDKQIKEISQALSIPTLFLQKLVHFFDEAYISFLEINPLIAKESEIYLLDLAIEVDSAGEFFAKKYWSNKDFAEDPLTMGKTEEEKFVRQLKENSQASLKLELLNPNGSIFVMLFGGGGSIVIADEIYNQGFGKELANYGDYSGNPNLEETYLYVKSLVSLLLKSKAKKKVFLIAGGTANFTDVRVTFRGAMRALNEVLPELKKQKIKIFVRRPGPNQVEGLQLISSFLYEHDLYGGVWDQHMVLTDVVNKAIAYIK